MLEIRNSQIRSGFTKTISTLDFGVTRESNAVSIYIMLGEKNMMLSNLNEIFELFKENVMGCIMSIILAGVIKFVKNMRDNIAKFSNLRNRKIIDSVIVGKM